MAVLVTDYWGDHGSCVGGGGGSCSWPDSVYGGEYDYRVGRDCYS